MRKAVLPNRKARPPAEVIRGLAEAFKVLADPSRLRILMALAQDGEHHVLGLSQLLGLTAPNTSNHLKVLRLARLVVGARRGKNTCYRLASDRLEGILVEVVRELPLLRGESAEAQP
jgi:DNA-binding transcriptional ArsR family regulator